jgi:hypothetical protein
LKKQYQEFLQLHATNIAFPDTKMEAGKAKERYKENKNVTNPDNSSAMKQS